MELEELKERYKMLPILGRMGIAILLGLLPAAYTYFEEGEALQSQLDQARSDEESARLKFEAARQKKANLPKLEEQLAFTEEQLAKARKKLPDSFRIEEILQRTATIAKEVGVSLKVFKPEAQQAAGREEFRYMEMPIQTEVEGKFADIAVFLDRMVHLEQSVFVHDVDLESVVPNLDNLERGDKSNHAIAKDVRANLKVKGQVKLAVFRAMTDAESQAAGGEAPPAKGKADSANAQPAQAANPGAAGGSE